MITLLNIPRINCASDDLYDAVRALRCRLDRRDEGGDGHTGALFGPAVAPQQVVERICGDVRARGLAAVLEWTERLDGVALDPAEVHVAAATLRAAFRASDTAFLRAVRRLRDSVLTFQSGLLHRDAVLRSGRGCAVRLRYRPLRRVGVCVSGRTTSVSTLLTTVVPAQAAGVEEIAVVVPPGAAAAARADLLAACHALGVSEVYRMSGVPAVAALAFGVEGIEAVDKIVGTGDRLVVLAQRLVHGAVDAETTAGPGELVLLADWTAEPRLVAADLIAQAASDSGSAVLVTWDTELIEQVVVELTRQLDGLEESTLVRDNLERFGALILARDEDEAVRLANLIAPGLLHVSTADPPRLAERLTAAGAIFLGHDTPVALGDHVAGPMHLLPTGGAARWASGLSANDFLRCTTIVHVDRTGLEALAPDLRRLADHEGRAARRRSVDVRLDDDIDDTP
jgi:histidinol dehydrogenase